MKNIKIEKSLKDEKFEKILVLVFVLPLLFACNANNEPAPVLTMATTTSMNDSGLLDVLAPAFKEDTGIELQWTSLGSGAAMQLARDGEAEVLFAHSPAAEETLVADGVSTGRHIIMFNNFLFVGPESLGTDDLATAVRDICENRPYVSRDDQSGTHTQEVNTFKQYCDSERANNEITTGEGMLATLNVANEEGRFTLVDIATWLQNRADLPNLTEAFYNKDDLINVYSVHAINSDNFSAEQKENANKFIQWMEGSHAQELIANYGVDKFGEPVFFLGSGPSN